jgi:hypothetical protein
MDVNDFFSLTVSQKYFTLVFELLELSLHQYFRNDIDFKNDDQFI